MSSFRAAVIGKGFIFPRHKLAVKHIGGKIDLTCDIDPETKPNFTDWLAMFNSRQFKKITHVIICTPNYLHYPMIIAALDRGKKVLCEKPLALSVREIEDLAQRKDVFGVMQLRHHPVMQELRQLTRPRIVNLYVSVKRGPEYWSGWKGNEDFSGGILQNLAVHYLDALMEFLGTKYRIIFTHYTPRTAVGTIDLAGTMVCFFIEITDDGVGQGRWISIDGKKYVFSDKDNLSFEDLHKNVYEELAVDIGVTPLDVLPVTRLINDLKFYGRV